MSKLKIIALSDTHTFHRKVTVPDGDVLVYAGDLMGSGYRHDEVKDFAKWWNNLPHANKILVAGNHDRMFQGNLDYCLDKFSGTTYLQDSEVVIDGVKFYGSPWQPEFYNWAFNVPRGTEIKKYWDKIPDDVDCLITHGPPYGILDQIISDNHIWRSDILVHPTEHLGCEELDKQVAERIKPKVHIFGHIHGGYGYYKNKVTRFYNVSICDERYFPVNPVTVIEV